MLVEDNVIYFYGNLLTVARSDIEEGPRAEYWSVLDSPYRYIPPGKFAEAFRSYPAGKNLSEELAVPFDKRYNHPAALATYRYGVKRRELLRTSFHWQRLLMKRNSFIYVFKFIQNQVQEWWT
uniref:Uncharacterized protein n=1 Tax=Quercus lobata TaxID=97700 RepID=A0A7N2RBB9_QUELO